MGYGIDPGLEPAFTNFEGGCACFDRYLELLLKFVVRYGEERKWTPIQINGFGA